MSKLTWSIASAILAVLLFIHPCASLSGNASDSSQKLPQARSLRLFIIGNSFSQNASRYLPHIAKEKNYRLEIGRAELGGCSLKRHWEIVEAAEADTTDPKGKQYKGKSLRMLLSEGKWDVVTIQQYSRLSGNPDSYRPYARKLYEYIRKLQPNARIMMHQTWAYRSDANSYGQISEDRKSKNQVEMHESVRSAYHTIARELEVDIIPTGDAFWAINSNSKLAYKKDKTFDFNRPIYPLLPNQQNSLHVGYYWSKDYKLVKDANHANKAGEYLGSLVWFKSLFNVSPKSIKFKPEEVSEKFAKELKDVAATTAIPRYRKSETENEAI